MARVHQIIVSASDGDAITQMALKIRDEFSRFSESNIYAYWNHSEKLKSHIKPLSELPDDDSLDILIYHSSIGHPEVHKKLMNRNDKIVLMYHNITPSEFYAETNPEFAAHLELGREELGLLQQRVQLVIADSQFNASDLRQYGYSHVEVIPAGFTPYRLRGQLVDAPLVRDLKTRFRNGFVLVVGQVLPHKRVEQTIEAVHILNSTYNLGVGLVICGAQRQHVYAQSLLEHMKSLPFVGVMMAGAVSDQHLATYYKAASVYLSMSDHEGLCIPPTEAMAVGTPVIAKATCAIPETLGDGALLLSTDAGPVIAAEAIREILTNNDERVGLQLRGRARAQTLHQLNSVERSVELIMSVTS